jgi:hypothetical protein
MRIDGAYAHAYPSMPAPSTSCPRPGETLDQRKTEKGGAFELQVDANRPSYYAVYCSNGFQTSEVPTNDNTMMSDVRPTPVRLFPNRSPKLDEQSAAWESIVRVLDTATVALRGIQRSVGSAFAQVIAVPADAEAVKVLAMRKESTPAFDLRLQPASPQRMIVIILNDATIHLTYFNRAAPEGYPGAVRKFSTDEQRAIERLRTRPLAPLPPK